MSVRTGLAEGWDSSTMQKGGGACCRSTKGGGRLRQPPTFVDLSGGGISALRLVQIVRSVHSCARLAKTKVLCPAGTSDVFSGPPNGPEPEKVECLSAKMQVSSENQNLILYFWRSAHRWPLFTGTYRATYTGHLSVAQYNTARTPQIICFGKYCTIAK